MSAIPPHIAQRLATCSRTAKARHLATELDQQRAFVGALDGPALHSESVRAGACLQVALENLSTAIRELRLEDAETEMHRALSFAAWSQACRQAVPAARLAA